MATLLFSECGQVANRMYQNYKTTLKRRSAATKDRIEALLDYTQKLKPFDNNFYLDKLAKHLEAYKMSSN